MICSNECSFNPVTIKRRRLSVVVGWRECWDRVSVISLPMGKMLVSVPGIYTEHLLLISEGIEPSTFSVLTKCDNRYTMNLVKHMGDVLERVENRLIYTPNHKNRGHQTIRNWSQNQTTFRDGSSQQNASQRCSNNPEHQSQDNFFVNGIYGKDIVQWSLLAF
jgi:hypothetical protein